MSKKGGSLTGGTGDVNPQLFRLAVSTATTITSGQQIGAAQTQPVPINRLGQKGEKVVVMELLKVRYHLEIGAPIAATNPQLASRSMIVFLSTSPPNPASLGVTLNPPFAQFPLDPKVIDFYEIVNVLTFTSTNQEVILSGVATTQPTYHDLTDGAGHGILVATDNITLTTVAGIIDLGTGIIGSQAATIVSTQANCDIIYRFKEVSLKEYIGIVQSQQ